MNFEKIITDAHNQMVQAIKDEMQEHHVFDVKFKRDYLFGLSVIVNFRDGVKRELVDSVYIEKGKLYVSTYGYGLYGRSHISLEEKDRQVVLGTIWAIHEAVCKKLAE